MVIAGGTDVDEAMDEAAVLVAAKIRARWASIWAFCCAAAAAAADPDGAKVGLAAAASSRSRSSFERACCRSNFSLSFSKLPRWTGQ